MTAIEVNFKVCTLNCWGIPIASKDRKCRMAAIAETLKASDYDVVCLQEVWTKADFTLIRDKICGVLPYSHYFYSGVIGSGICIFSKYSFQDVFFHMFPVNGYFHKIQHGDWYGGKGVGFFRIKFNQFAVNVYISHFHANYGSPCSKYEVHRALQAYDAAQFIHLTSGNADLVILAGDLNTTPDDLGYRILTKVANLKDSFTYNSNSVETLGTSENPHNSYTRPSMVEKMTPGERIDYIMFLGGSAVKVDVSRYEHPLRNRVPECTYSYSDHEAIATTLTISRNSSLTSVNIGQGVNVLEESVDMCNNALKQLNTSKHFYCFITAILIILLIITVIITDVPFKFTIYFNVIRVVITVLMCFSLIMSTIWNMTEKNAILAAKLTMEASLKTAHLRE